MTPQPENNPDVWLPYLLLLLQLLIEGVIFGLGCGELLLGGFQLFLSFRLSVLHLVLQHLELFLRLFLHLFRAAQSLLAVLWFRQDQMREPVQHLD